MAGIEYEYNLGRAPYDVRIDSERYEQLLLEKANPRYPVKDLKIIIGRSGFLFDAVLVGRKKIYMSSGKEWKTYSGGSPAEGEDELASKLFHETKHALDLQNPFAVVARSVYWVGITQLVYLTSEHTLESVSPTNPFNRALASSLTLASFQLLYKIDPFEIRANSFAKSMIEDQAYSGIVRISPKD